MEIHDLNTKTLTDPAYVAFDDGTDTYKTEFNDVLEEKTAAAVAATDLTQNQVAFTSGDAESPTAWSNVSVITSGSTLATLFNRVSTMVKNVRYLKTLIDMLRGGTKASGTDLNDIMDTSVYILTGSNTYAHMPTNVNNGTLMTFAPSSTFIVQELYSGNGNLFIRRYTNSAWSGWFKYTGTAV